MYSQLSLLDVLNGEQTQEQLLPMPDAEVILHRNAFKSEESNQLYFELYSTIDWKQEFAVLFNRSIALPRLTAWYGDSGKAYTYSNITMEPRPWNSVLIAVKERVEAISYTRFNSVLLNLYRNGQDSVGWHSDDEPELGKKPVIASVSFGTSRRFVFRHKHQKNSKLAMELTHGSLLIMRGPTQHFWQHQIPKTSRVVQPRINLTFRFIK